MDIRLEEYPFELKGKTYLLRCNFNVLADIINDFGKMPDLNNMTIFPRLLAPMLNDYADEQGWPERYTGKELGRILPTSMFVTEEGQKQILKITEIVLHSVYADVGEKSEETDNQKN